MNDGFDVAHDSLQDPKLARVQMIIFGKRVNVVHKARFSGCSRMTLWKEIGESAIDRAYRGLPITHLPTPMRPGASRKARAFWASTTLRR
jgi:hypothetical protein